MHVYIILQYSIYCHQAGVVAHRRLLPGPGLLQEHIIIIIIIIILLLLLLLLIIIMMIIIILIIIIVVVIHIHMIVIVLIMSMLMRNGASFRAPCERCTQVTRIDDVGVCPKSVCRCETQHLWRNGIENNPGSVQGTV